MISLIVIIALSYLVGSIPASVWIGKASGVDIRRYGSGNAGATNVFRVLGWKAGAIATLADSGKGFLAAGLIASLRLDSLPSGIAAWEIETVVRMIAGVAAVVGHMFPVLAGFRGGKGVNTSAGALLAITPVTMVIALGVFILVLFGLSLAAGVASHELLSTLGLFAYAGLRIQPSLQKVVSGLNSMKFSVAALDQVYDDLRLVEEVDTPGSPRVELSLHNEIRLDHVSFAYEGAVRAAVADASLTIRRGEMIGICGPTGGGKTTLTDLIIGMLDPTNGRVTVDDVDIANPRCGYDQYGNVRLDPNLLRALRPDLDWHVGVPDADYPHPCLQVGRRTGTAYAAVDGVSPEVLAHSWFTRPSVDDRRRDMTS
jgi:acyl phosphate:glycerol-3-phosphate acyltransferase